MKINRGDLITIVTSGDYGKPRPALVIQSDNFAKLPSVTVLRLTSDLYDAPMLRIPVRASPNTGLKKPSQIMIDKAVTVPRQKIGQRLGAIDKTTLETVSNALA